MASVSPTSNSAQPRCVHCDKPATLQVRGRPVCANCVAARRGPTGKALDLAEREGRRAAATLAPAFEADRRAVDEYFQAEDAIKRDYWKNLYAAGFTDYDFARPLVCSATPPASANIAQHPAGTSDEHPVATPKATPGPEKPRGWICDRRLEVHILDPVSSAVFAASTAMPESAWRQQDPTGQNRLLCPKCLHAEKQRIADERAAAERIAAQARTIAKQSTPALPMASPASVVPNQAMSDADRLAQVVEADFIRRIAEWRNQPENAGKLCAVCDRPAALATATYNLYPLGSRSIEIPLCREHWDAPRRPSSSEQPAIVRPTATLVEQSVSGNVPSSLEQVAIIDRIHVASCGLCTRIMQASLKAYDDERNVDARIPAYAALTKRLGISERTLRNRRRQHEAKYGFAPVTPGQAIEWRASLA